MICGKNWQNGFGRYKERMTELEVKAYAKINIGLDVVRRLENGYHEVRMIMQTLSLHDTVRLERCAQRGIRVTTDSELLKEAEDNLVYRAAQSMFEHFGLPGGIRIHLEKKIPIAAGMAGGSADAAAVFRGMRQLYGLDATVEELQELGVRLGADIPYCIVGGTCLSEGIGEVLTKMAPLPECYVLVAKPSVGVSTKWVYENLHADRLEVHPDITGMKSAIEAQNLDRLVLLMDNVLEPVTVRKYPVICEIEKMMESHGALRAMMSGSGPTVFGLYDDERKAREAYTKMQESKLAKNVFLTRFFHVKDMGSH